MSASMRIVAIVLVELFVCIGADMLVRVCQPAAGGERSAYKLGKLGFFF